MGDGDHYSPALLLRGGDRAARFQRKGSANDIDFVWRFLFRTKSFCGQQSRGSSVLSSLLEYERTFFRRFPAFLRSGRRDCPVCRSALQAFAALDCAGSLFAAILAARPAPLDAFWV